MSCAKLGSRGMRFGFYADTIIVVRKFSARSCSTKRHTSCNNKITRKARFSYHSCCGLLLPRFVSMYSPAAKAKLNIDWQGNVTLCCHLSGCGDGTSTKDIIGNLNEISFIEAKRKLKQLVGQFHKYKNPAR